MYSLLLLLLLLFNVYMLPANVITPSYLSSVHKTHEEHCRSDWWWHCSISSAM